MPSESEGTHSRSFADASEADEFARVLAAFERGDIGPDEWRAFRLSRGSYGQRQDWDAQMVRVKIPQGVLDVRQLEALAEVAARWSRGFGHVTTRQNVQFHFVRLHDVETVMRRVAEAGLTTREACGNTVRNVTACPYAGVAADEAFDVTPYAEAFTRHFLRHPLGGGLPRKFKVAFEGCPEDHAFAAINDIGWHARVREHDGRRQRGFRVVAGGGTATLCTSAAVIAEFLPATDVLVLAEAIVRVFHRLGDYEHRQRNRMKFLLRQLGWEAWKAEVERELETVRAEGSAVLPFDPEDPPDGSRPRQRHAAAAPLPPASAAYAAWARTNVRPQRQPGYCVVTVTLPLGDVTATQLRALAALCSAHGDGTLRTTHDQNLLLRWVPAAELGVLYHALDGAGLARPGAGTLADVTSCPGAESCRIAVTHSRGVARLLAEHLAARPDRVAAAPGLDVKISGCPNGCGQHHVAGIGLQGSVRQVGGRPVPQYFVMLGGGVGAEGAHFARLAAKVPARRVPEAVERLLALHAEEGAPGEDARAFLRRVPLAQVKERLADLEAIDAETAQPGDFVDLDEVVAPSGSVSSPIAAGSDGSADHSLQEPA